MQFLKTVLIVMMTSLIPSVSSAEEPFCLENICNNMSPLMALKAQSDWSWKKETSDNPKTTISTNVLNIASRDHRIVVGAMSNEFIHQRTKIKVSQSGQTGFLVYDEPRTISYKSCTKNFVALVDEVSLTAGPLGLDERHGYSFSPGSKTKVFDTKKTSKYRVHKRRSGDGDVSLRSLSKILKSLFSIKTQYTLQSGVRKHNTNTQQTQHIRVHGNYESKQCSLGVHSFIYIPAPKPLLLNAADLEIIKRPTMAQKHFELTREYRRVDYSLNDLPLTVTMQCSVKKYGTLFCSGPKNGPYKSNWRLKNIANEYKVKRTWKLLERQRERVALDITVSDGDYLKISNVPTDLNPVEILNIKRNPAKLAANNRNKRWYEKTGKWRNSWYSDVAKKNLLSAEIRSSCFMLEDGSFLCSPSKATVTGPKGTEKHWESEALMFAEAFDWHTKDFLAETKLRDGNDGVGQWFEFIVDLKEDRLGKMVKDEMKALGWD